MTKRTLRNAALATALVGLATLLLLWLRPDPAPPAKPQPPAPGSAATSASAPRMSTPGNTPPGVEPTMPDAEARAHALERARRALALYQEAMVYPPWSRPFDGSTRHIVEWNHIQGLGQPFAADENGREIRVDAALDRLFAGPGEELTARLSITYADDGTPVVPDEITGAVEHQGDGPDWEHGAAVPFVHEGDAYLARFVPSRLPALAESPRDAHFLAHVRVGRFFKRLPLRFVYSAQKPLTIHGMSGEAIRDGSLEVLLDVEVKHIAPTLVQAGLFDASGEHAIAIFDEYVRPTTTGTQQIVLRFFGKILRERGIDGPYRLRALHGHVRVPDAVPPEVFWSHPDEPPIRTRHYKASDFASSDWSSPEKKAKIALYKNVIEELERTTH